jgi:two-component system nitrate/nitrite response regulator NarL
MLKVLLIDDHKILLYTLKMVLQKNDRIEVVAAISDPHDVLKLLNSIKVDLIITDLNMPDISGFELIKRIKMNLPTMKFAVLTMYYSKQLINELMDLNIDAFLHKTIDIDELNHAIQQIESGQKYFSKDIKTSIYQDLRVNLDNKIVDSFGKQFFLSSRELEIFFLIIEGKSSQNIADLLYISRDTVSTHRKNIIKKTGCSTALEMMKLASSIVQS